MRPSAEPDSVNQALRQQSFVMDTLKASPGRDDRDLDMTDRRILRVLQSEGRISKLKLAEAVHLSPAAVLERVKRLS